MDLLESDKMQFSELDIFDAVLRWGKHQLLQENEHSTTISSSSSSTPSAIDGRVSPNDPKKDTTLKADSDTTAVQPISPPPPPLRDQTIEHPSRGAEHETRKLASILADVLPFIRFPTLTATEILEHIEPTRVVPTELLLEAYRYHALPDRLSHEDLITHRRFKVREGSLFFVAGVQENISLKLLRGWTKCYHAPYSDRTTSKVFEKCLGRRILIGAKHRNSNALALCAMGRLSVVTKETHENETNFDNGVHWYHWAAHAFGFAANEHINLGSADIADGTHRLSWHLTGRGGYRVGEIRNLNESDEYEKLIFWSN